MAFKHKEFLMAPAADYRSLFEQSSGILSGGTQPGSQQGSADV
jgi:hypothetical protein